MKKEFWFRFPGLQNLRRVIFSQRKIEIEISFQKGRDFEPDQYYINAKKTLEELIPGVQLSEDQCMLVVETSLDEIPMSQKSAEKVVLAMGWGITTLNKVELAAVTKKRI